MDHREPNVALKFWNPSDQEILEKFHLTDEQLAFTLLPKVALKEATDDRNRYPVVITRDEIPVGFFVLHCGRDISEYSPNPEVMLLRSLSVDSPYQGKGVAKRAMMLVPAFVELYFPDIREIVLAVNYRNTVAKKMYLESGFIDTGTTREGKSGPQYLLHYNL